MRFQPFVVVLLLLVGARRCGRRRDRIRIFCACWRETREFRLGRPTGIKPTPDGKAVLFLRAGRPRADPVAVRARRRHRQDAHPAHARPAAAGRGGEALGRGEGAARAQADRRPRVHRLRSERGRAARAGRALGAALRLPPARGRQAGKVQALGAQRAARGRRSFFARRRAGGLRARARPLRRRRRHRQGAPAHPGRLVRPHPRPGGVRRPGGDGALRGVLLVARLAAARLHRGRPEAGSSASPSAIPARPEVPASVFAYPRAGKANARVRLGVITAGGGATTWVRWDSDKYPYLARVFWKEKKAPLSVLVQTREQREQVLLDGDQRSGAHPPDPRRDRRGLGRARRRAAALAAGGQRPAGGERAQRPPRARAAQRRRQPRCARWFPATLGFLDLARRRRGRRLGLRAGRHPHQHPPLPGAPAGRGRARPLTDDAAEHQPVFAKNGTLYVDTRTAADALATQHGVPPGQGPPRCGWASCPRWRRRPPSGSTCSSRP